LPARAVFLALLLPALFGFIDFRRNCDVANESEASLSSSDGWTVALDFDDGRLGQPAVGADAFDAVPMGTAPTYYSDAHVFSGTSAAEINVAGGDTLYGGIKEFPTKLRVGDELWIRFRVYWPAGFDWSANPWLKFFRVHTRSPERDNEGYMDWYINNPEVGTHPPFQLIKEFHDQWRLFGDTRDAPRRGAWETYEAHYVFDSVPAAEGGRGLAQVWKDGRLLGEFDDIRTLESDQSWAHSFQMWDWNGGAPKDQTWYVDDVVLTTRRPAGRDADGNPMVGDAAVEGDAPVSLSFMLLGGLRPSGMAW
jgi:hypothetical protein